MSSNNARVSITQSRRQEVIAVLEMFAELFRAWWNYGLLPRGMSQLSQKDDEELSVVCSGVWDCLDELSGNVDMYIARLSSIDWDEFKEGLSELRNEDNQ